MSSRATPTRFPAARPHGAPQRLRYTLAINGAVFALRGALNVVAPSSFYLPDDPPRYAKDVVRLLGVTYLAIASAQVQTALRGDDSAVRQIGAASMLFAGGAALVALSSGASRRTRFDRVKPGSALENGVLCVTYGALIVQAHRQRRLLPDS